MGLLATVWRMVLAVVAVLAAAAGPTVLIAAAGILLFLTSQGPELGRSIADSGARGIGGLLFACIVWAVMSWFWARQLLNERFGLRAGWGQVTTTGRTAPALPDTLVVVGNKPGKSMARAARGRLRLWLGFWVVWVPRLCAMAPFAIAAIMLVTTWGKNIAALGVAALLLLVFLSLRRHLATLVGWTDMRPRMGRIGLAFSVITIGLFLCFPVWLGQTFGAVGSIFLFFAALLPPMAALSFWAARWRVPMLLMVFAALALLPQFHRDRHLVRERDEATPPGRIAMAMAVHEWIRNQPETIRHPPGAVWNDAEAIGDVPLVMVTTAGGGISAAVWTALLLSALQDQDRRFAARVFAISGVSGGALGAAVFAAAVPPLGEPGAAAIAACRTGALRNLSDCGVAGIAHVALEPDFLGPLFAGLAFGDTIGPIFRGWVRNRAAVLENAWEAACARAGCPAMAESFHGLRPGEEWRPALFLNGTHVESGKRIITSPLAITLRYFDDAFDFFALHGRDIRLSTAALNAARFPYVTPAGLMRTAGGARNGHIADGGYFENYGAETGAEVQRAVRVLLDESELRGIRPVLIEISSDPALTERDLWRPGGGQDAARCDATAQRTNPESPLPLCGDGRGGGLTQLRAPVSALLATRSARGVQTVRRVWRRAKEDRAEAVQFALCPQGAVHDGRPPLGWSLSRGTRDAIAADVVALFRDTPILDPCRERNRLQMIRLRALLRE